MTWSQRLLAVFFTAAGLLHFLRPGMYEEIVPEYLPAPHELVLASGAAEIAGGIGVIPERTRRLAGFWLAATLIAVFPANVHMALHPERYPQIPHAALLARLPLQLVMIWLVWEATIRRP